MVPAFLMSGVPGLFPNAAMGGFRKPRRIGLPDVAITGALTNGGRDPVPQPSTGAFTVVAKDKREEVTSAAQEHRPQPPRIDPVPDETLGLIDCQHLISLRRWKRLPQRW
jgi:hypothetical protein